MPRPKAFDEDKSLLAAMELFWQRGYASTSLADLTACMGISRQSLYDTYGDKHRLFLKALDRYCALVGERLVGPLSAADAGITAITQTVFAFIEFLVAFPTPRACLMANSAMEIAPHDQAVAAKVKEFHAQLAQAFAGALTNAQRRGEIANMTAAATLASFLVATANGLAIAAKTGADKDELRAIAGVALASLWPVQTQSPSRT